MNIPDDSSFLYISCKNVDYNAVNSLMAKNFLLDKVEYNYYSAVIRYILGRILKKHFDAKLKAYKNIRERRLLPKYSNWLMSFKSIQYAMQKADVILFPILPLNEALIAKTINILY